MNIEIANRLVNLRKKNGLSQEALAEKLGISRQAVSKWERAEASPDTDNIILLARLYGVSLDELLQTEDEIPAAYPEENRAEAEAGETGDIKNGVKAGEANGTEEHGNGGTGENGPDQEPEYVHVGLDGIHVVDRDGSNVHVGWNGVHVEDGKKGENVHVGKNGVFVNGKKYDWDGKGSQVPFTAVILLLYVLVGFFYGAWHPAWLLFLLVPLWYSFVEAVRHGNPCLFAYPVFAALLYLCLGFFWGAWHPGWVVFLTVPVYYSVASNRRRTGGAETIQKDPVWKDSGASDGERR